MTALPCAAWMTRAAFVASIVCRPTAFITAVSTSCASMTGAVTSMTGSSAKTRSPSLIARTSPVNRREGSQSRKLGIEQVERAQVGDVGTGEAERLEVVERFLEPGEDGVAAVRRQVSEGEAEGGGGVVAVLPVRLRHGQFVEVGEERAARCGFGHIPMLRRGARPVNRGLGALLTPTARAPTRDAPTPDTSTRPTGSPSP